MALPAAELAARMHQAFGAVGMGTRRHRVEFATRASQVANDVQMRQGALLGARTPPVMLRAVAASRKRE